MSVMGIKLRDACSVGLCQSMFVGLGQKVACRALMGLGIQGIGSGTIQASRNMRGVVYGMGSLRIQRQSGLRL